MEVLAGQFIRKLRKYARKNNFEFEYLPEEGPGSHGTVILNGKLSAIVGERKMIREGLLKKICSDLDVKAKDFL